MRHLVLVDDNILLLKVLKMVFSEHFEVVEFSIPSQAVEYFEKNTDKLDIIISDFKMPNLNGVEVLRKAKEYKESTTRIILTGYSDNSIITENKDVYDVVLDKNLYKDTDQFIEVINDISNKKG